MPPLLLPQSLQVYSLNCSVCQVDFFSGQEWLKHLVEEDHQKLAKNELIQQNYNLKEQCLVIFSKYSITKEGAVRIVNYFGSRRQLTLVTDFVWWEDRPRIGIIQFESRKIAIEVLGEIVTEASSDDLLIDDQRIQVKGAAELPELEWTAILPVSDPAPPPPLPRLVQKITKEIRTHFVNNQTDEHKDSDDDDDTKSQQESETDNAPCPIQLLTKYAKDNHWKLPEYKVKKLRVPEVKKYLCSVILNGQTFKPSWLIAGSSSPNGAITKAAKFCLESLKFPKPPASSLQPQTSPVPSQLNLTKFQQSQLKPIYDLVRIPDPEYQKVLKVVKTFESLLTKRDPHIRAVIFRNGYLQLRNSVSNQLLVYVYSEAEPTTNSASRHSCNFTWLPGKLIISATTSTDQSSNQLFTCNDQSFPIAKDLTDTRLGCIFTHLPTKLSFEVVTHTKLIVEAQLCQLVKYICTFDPVTTVPLFTLVHYWAIVNKVLTGEVNVSPRRVHQALPEPSTLEWLVITFLIQEGVVPSVREILERPHKKIIEGDTDAGFDADPNFAMGWASRHKPVKSFLELLHLFRDFMTFCQMIVVKGNSLVNTKDGEVLNKENFFTKPDTNVTRLSAEERDSIVKLRKFHESDLVKQWKWYMIHPLEVQWRFSSSKGKPAAQLNIIVKETVEKFGKLLRMVNKQGMENALEKMGNLENILKIGTRKRTREDSDDEEKEDHPKNKLLKPNCSLENTATLQCQFDLIRKRVTVPDPTDNEASSEVQLQRLFKYMMTFDPRFEHALTLLHYWTNANGVKIGGHGDSDCKASLTTQWLLMHFMCYRKYIPTPREIQARPHQILEDELSGIDFGFDADLEFSSGWKTSHKLKKKGVSNEGFMVHVLKLLLEFFQFCGDLLEKDKFILNTKDGENIKTCQFLLCPPGKGGNYSTWSTNMSEEEYHLLKGLQAQKGNGVDGRHQNTNYFEDWHLHMIHPFDFKINFCVNIEIGFVFKLMKSCEVKLRKFLNVWENNGKEKARERFGTLENILTVDKVKRRKLMN